MNRPTAPITEPVLHMAPAYPTCAFCQCADADVRTSALHGPRWDAMHFHPTECRAALLIKVGELEALLALHREMKR